MVEIILWAFCVFETLLVLALSRGAARALRNLPRLSATQPSPEASVDVVVPARNEEGTLEAGLRSLVAQEGIDFRITVINDHSTDRTGEIADTIAREDSRVRVIHDPDLPPGWLGKCNALQKGAADASAPFILFTDADIVHLPGCLTAAVSEMEKANLDLLTLIPLMEWKTLWEHTFVPLFFAAMSLLDSPRMKSPTSREAAGAGAFAMIRTDIYRALGSHEALRDAVIDDVQMARNVKRAGHKVGLRIAEKFLLCRMYRSNREAFWGIEKNILDVVEGKPWLMVLALPFLLPITQGGVFICASGAMLKSWPMVFAGVALHVLQWAGLLQMKQIFKFDPVRLFFFPIGIISGGCCAAKASYYRFVRGSIVWRGREVCLKKRVKS